MTEVRAGLPAGARAGLPSDRAGLRSTLLRRGIAVCLLALAACGDATGPSDDRIRIDVPAGYRLVFDATVACSGLAGDFEGIAWFVTARFPDAPGVLGRWNSRREITLRLDSWLDATVIAHEIVHDLLRGDAQHQAPAWQKCGLPTGSDG